MGTNKSREYFISFYVIRLRHEKIKGLQFGTEKKKERKWQELKEEKRKSKKKRKKENKTENNEWNKGDQSG